MNSDREENKRRDDAGRRRDWLILAQRLLVGLLTLMVLAVLIVSGLLLTRLFKEKKAGRGNLRPAAEQAAAEEATPPPSATGLVYKQVEGQTLLLDLLMPTRLQKTPIPVVVFVHGGSWVAGDRQDVYAETRGPMQAALREAGFAVATIDYRLLDENTSFPHNVTDVQDSVRWLRKNADSYGLDPEAIGIWGSSAGGHLALLVAYLQESLSIGDATLADTAADVAFAISINGPTDLVVQFDEEVLNDALSQYIRSAPQLFFGPTFDLDCPTNCQNTLLMVLSPLYRVRQDLPPTLLFHGAKDQVVSVEQSRALVESLTEDGAPFRYLELPEAGHGLLPASADEVAEMVTLTVSFAEEALADRLP